MPSPLEVEMEGQFETASVDLRVVIFTHGHPLLYHIPLRPSDKWMDVFLKLEKYLVTSRGCWTNNVMKVVPYLTLVVYNATLCPVPIETITQDLPCIVDIGAKHRCHFLTKALRNPREVPARCDFVTSYRRFTTLDEAPGTIRARDALMVRLEFDKLIFLAFAMLSIIISIVCGAVAGVCWKSLDTGLSVFGAVIGVVGVVMAIFTYFLN